MNDYWLKHIKKNGIDLIVEIKLSFVEFKKLLSDTIGGEQSDDDVLEFWDIANRRILPTDQGSYSGIGYDINELIHEKLGGACDWSQLARDIPRLHQRLCWKCQKTHYHSDNHGPAVACPECKSMDTRADAATIKRLNNL